MSMEIGAYTFAEVAPDPDTGRPDAPRRLRELLEEAETAERAGLDVFGVGEHHRADFAVSAPAVALSAIAARTERLRLTSAVSVPTATRYSFSKRARSGVPRFHSSQKSSSAFSNSASRSSLRAFAWATIVGPYFVLKCSP